MFEAVVSWYTCIMLQDGMNRTSVIKRLFSNPSLDSMSNVLSSSGDVFMKDDYTSALIWPLENPQ